MKRILLCIVLTMSVCAMERYEKMVGKLVRKQDPLGHTILHWAACDGDDKLVAFICNETGVVKQAQNKYGNTALHLASYKGRTSVARYLIEKQGMDPTQENKFGENALHQAAVGGHEALVRYYLKKHDIDLRKKNTFGKNPCELAAQKRHRAVVNRFIQILGKRTRDGIKNQESEPALKRQKTNQKGFCPICLENVPKSQYNVAHYSCMHFLCGPCKLQLKNGPQKNRKCPICRGPLSN